MSDNQGQDRVFDSNDNYLFQGNGRQGLSHTAPEVERFARTKLNIKEEELNKTDKPYPELKKKLARFMTHHHLVINRYDELIKREKKIRNRFIVFTFTLLGGVPLLIFLASKFAGTGSAGNIVAQITGLLTGLFAIQKGLSSMLEKRAIVGNFYRAQAALKTALYSFEDHWRDKWKQKDETPAPGDAKSSIEEKLLADMNEKIEAARQVVIDEQTKYFDSLTYPAIDVGSFLTGSQGTAGSLAAKFKSSELKKKEQEEAHALARQGERKKLKQALRTLEKKKATVDKEINDITEALNALVSEEDPASRLKRKGLEDKRSRRMEKSDELGLEIKLKTIDIESD